MQEIFDVDYEKCRVQNLFEQCFSGQPIHGFVAFKFFEDDICSPFACRLDNVFALRLENVSDEQLEKSRFNYFLPPLIHGLYDYRVQFGHKQTTGLIRFHGEKAEIQWLDDEQAKELEPLWRIV